jgi:hypothetical protein
LFSIEGAAPAGGGEAAAAYAAAYAASAADFAPPGSAPIPFRPIVSTASVLSLLGFTPSDILTIYAARPSLAFDPPAVVWRTASNTLDLLTGTLKLRKYDARKLVREQPALLTLPVSVGCVSTIDYLTTLGVTQSWLSSNKRVLGSLLTIKRATLQKLVCVISDSLPTSSGFMPRETITKIVKHPDFPLILDKFCGEDELLTAQSYESLVETVHELTNCRCVRARAKRSEASAREASAKDKGRRS